MYLGLTVAQCRRKVVYSPSDDLKRMITETLTAAIRSIRLRSKQRERVNDIGGNPGKQVLRCRISQRITLEELSIRTGLSPAALHRIENDKTGFLMLPHTMVWTISQAHQGASQD